MNECTVSAVGLKKMDMKRQRGTVQCGIFKGVSCENTRLLSVVKGEGEVVCPRHEGTYEKQR
jgi:hypothetical protein